MQQGGAADKAGVSTGDRIIEVDREALEGHNHEYVVNLIKHAGEVIEMTILSTRKELPQMQSEDLLEDTPIFAQLLGHEKIEHKVEPRMFQNRRRRGKQEKRGTNFSNTGKKPEEADGDKKDDKNKVRKRKKKKDTKKVKFENGTDNLAFVDAENDEEKKKKKKRRKKKEKEGTDGTNVDKDKLSDEDDKRKHRRKSRRKKDEPANDEEKLERHKGMEKYKAKFKLILKISSKISSKIASKISSKISSIFHQKFHQNFIKIAS